MKCKAKAKSTGKPCRRDAMRNGTCQVHGGPTPRGLALPQTTHGLYSKSMPLRMAAKYREALEDVDLLSLRREAALLTTQLAEALERLDTGETGQLWTDLGRAWADMLAESGPKKAAALNEIGRMIERGASDAAAAREIRGVILDKTRVAESERKRLVEAHQVISAERLLALVGALSAAILEEVPDRERRARILDRFDRLL
jgi:hypothetical protein